MAKDIFENLRLDGKALALKTIQNKIEQFISTGIYSDLEDFISDNPNLETFQSRTKFNNTLKKVWGYQITEQEYLDILEQMRKEMQERKKINLENIQTVHANGKEITTYQSEKGTMVLDNSYATKSIEEQLPELQEEHKQFQTGGENNVGSMMDYMKQEIKPDLSFVDVSEQTNKNSLSSQEEENLAIATEYKEQTNTPIQADLENGIILQDGEIKTIETRDDEVGIYQAETSQAESEEDSIQAEKPKVRTLRMFKQAGFSSPLILAFLTGMVLGFAFLSVFAKTIIS